MKVIKRDGRVEDYDYLLIKFAIENAFEESGESPTCIEALILEVERSLTQELTTVQIIETLVENVLMENNYFNTARAYIEYRHERCKQREASGPLIKSIEGFLTQEDEGVTNENANKDAKVVSTHRDLLAGILSKHLAMTQILPKGVAKAHKEGYIHVHDLDYLVSPLTNCCLVNYRDMLKNGFCIGDAHITTPKSIGVATTVLTQIAQAVASSQYGGQSFAHIDTGLAPYVKASKKKLEKTALKYGLGFDYILGELKKEVYDAMQTFFYQINSLTTSNGQSPFVSISMGLDTSYEGGLITEAYLKIHTEGLGSDKRTPVFPKVIFFLEEGVNLKVGDPNYELKQLAMECSVKRVYPDFVSVPLNKQVTGASKGAVTSMGCRSHLSKWLNKDGEEQYDGRFNLGVATINLPLLAYESVSEEDFYYKLNKYFDLAVKAHSTRLSRLSKVKASENPIMWMEGALARLDKDDLISSLFYDGRSSISVGYIGLAETCEKLYGEYFKVKGQEILQHMKSKCEKLKADTGLGYSLYGTPSESTCYRLATLIKEKGYSLKNDFLTNSFHVPVWEDVGPIEKWEFEKGFSEISSGGFISYIETPNLSGNMKGLESLIDYAYKNVPYFGINQPVDKCYECGYEGEFTAAIEGFTCPSCGNTDSTSISVIRRVSGYLSAPNARPFNKGKQQEVTKRVKHIDELF